METDPGIRMKLLQAYFFNGDYNQTVSLGHMLESEKSFQDSNQRIVYAWALYHVGRPESAEKVFIGMDKSFANYEHRKEYCRFLLQLGRTEDAQVQAKQILDEFDYLQGSQRKLYSHIITQLKSLRNSLSER
jgi:hypothetical protein